LDRKEFHNLLNNFTSLTADEAIALVKLEQLFPYSQVIRGLAARGTQDNRLAIREDQLHLAAIYTTDRAVFKSIMTAAPVDRKPTPEKPMSTATEEQPTESQTKIEQINKVEGIPDQIPFSDDRLYDEVMRDIERLKIVKHEFEEAVKRYEVSRAEIIAPPKKKTNRTDPDDELLSEIKLSKKKMRPEGTRQKEQIEIIDQFIKTQPTIKGKMQPGVSPDNDLSENLDYNENIISETLAEILIRQGKKDKAIEVLKKLIWKFQQKKAYFAAQIEDLKK
jgi:hypothetical protein